MTPRERPAESSPPSAEPLLTVVERAFHDIHEAADRHRDLLLADLMCAAWPTATAQDQ